jgi:hypothetical protein
VVVPPNDTKYVENAIINAIVVGSVRRAIINVVMLVEGGHPEKNEAEVPTQKLLTLVWGLVLVFRIHILVILVNVVVICPLWWVLRGEIKYLGGLV